MVYPGVVLGWVMFSLMICLKGSAIGERCQIFIAIQVVTYCQQSVSNSSM